MSEGADEQRALERARFIDRFVAFSIDYVLLLLAGYGVLYVVLDAAGPSPGNQTMLLRFWLVFWMAGFLIYHAALSAGGRASVGKRLLGLQIYTQEGYPLSFGTASLRSAGYLLSSVLFGLGFLWALFSSKKLAWHDMLSKTMVLEERPRPRLWVWVAALFFLVVDAGLLAGPLAVRSYTDMRHRANAEAALAAVANFQERHKEKTGAYTEDVAALGRVYGDPKEFLTLLGQSLNLKSVKIDASRDRFTIRAAALDGAGTEYEVTGPQPK